MRSPIGGPWPDLRGVIASLSMRQALKVGRMRAALEGNLRGRAIQFLKIVCCQFDESRADILLQSVQFCSAWDGDDPRLLGKEPGESDLSGGCMFPRRERLNNIYQTDSPLEPPGRTVGTCHGCPRSNFVFSVIVPARYPFPRGL